jgi:hypothetical protein
MSEFDLDPEMLAFIDRYLEVSSLSTATGIAQQRHDYDAIVQYFCHAHPAGITSVDSIASGRICESIKRLAE